MTSSIPYFQKGSITVGTLFVVFIMIVIILFGYILIKGPPPRFFLPDPRDSRNNEIYELDENGIQGGSTDTLQMRVIPFKKKGEGNDKDNKKEDKKRIQ